MNQNSLPEPRNSAYEIGVLLGDIVEYLHNFYQKLTTDIFISEKELAEMNSELDLCIDKINQIKRSLDK